MNEILLKGKIYKLVCIWRKDKNDKSKDIRGKLFSYPKENKPWSGQKQFISKLEEIETFLTKNKKIISLPDKKCTNCLLCDKTCITTKRFIVNEYIWDNGLMHYIRVHNINPDEEFIDKIFKYYIPINKRINVQSRLELKNNTYYLKIDKNQLMILDALMKHGGYTKKYYDTQKRNIFRYSEHSGYFDIRMKNVENIIVQGNTVRVDRGDEEIFLPINSDDTFNYEYIFHTHPPTPKPGGRAIDGILYEFPSIGDIFHFVNHYNGGKTIGSLVMTAEGLYNIRKYINDNEKIKFNEDEMYNKMMKLFIKLQDVSIKKYGTEFSSYEFYSVIAHDTSYITKINNVLNKYDLAIDFYPRVKDIKGSWIVDNIYLPVIGKI